MSSIIDKLKVKPVPNKEKGVEIVIANEKKKTKDEIEKGIMDRLTKNIASKSKVKSNIDNVEDTRLEIVDKTKDKSFKVDDFMDRLKKNRVITNITEEEKRNEMEKMKTKRSKSKKIQIQEEITNNNFKICMQEEESLNNGSHVFENIGWMAVSKGSFNLDNMIFESKNISLINHNFKSVNFDSNFKLNLIILSFVFIYITFYGIQKRV